MPVTGKQIAKRTLTVTIIGVLSAWAIWWLSSILFKPTPSINNQSVSDIKTGNHSPVTVNQQIVTTTETQNVIDPSKIYISLWEQSREIALNQSGVTVPPIYPISPNQEFVFRVILRQENTDGVYIPHIHITFPDTAEVKPDLSDLSGAGAWTKNNDSTNTYVLNYLSISKFYNETPYNLPALHVKVKDTKIPMSYRLKVDGLSKSIERNFVIDTTLDYNVYYKQHFSFNTAECVPELEHTLSADTGGIFRRIVHNFDKDKNNITASSTCVTTSPRNMPQIYPFGAIKADMEKPHIDKISFFSQGNNDSSVTPTSTLNSYPSQSQSTVTADADTRQ